MNNYVLNYKSCLHKLVQINNSMSVLQDDFKRNTADASAYCKNISELIDYLPFFPELYTLVKKEVENLLRRENTPYKTLLDLNTKETVSSLNKILTNHSNVTKNCEQLSNNYTSIFSKDEFLNTKTFVDGVLQKVTINNLKTSESTIHSVSHSLDIISKDLLPLYNDDLLIDFANVKKCLLETIRHSFLRYTIPSFDVEQLKTLLYEILKKRDYYKIILTKIERHDVLEIVKLKSHLIEAINLNSSAIEELSNIYEIYKCNCIWLEIVLNEYRELITLQLLGKYTAIKKELINELEERYDNPHHFGKLNKLNLIKDINELEYEYQEFVLNYDTIGVEERLKLGENFHKLELLKNFNFAKLESDSIRDFILLLRHNNLKIMSIRKEVGIMKNYISEKDLEYADIPIAKGGEGSIYKVIDNSNTCYKKFHTHVNIEDKKDKLSYMQRNKYDSYQGEYYSICWPENLVYHNNQFTGFVMKLANPEALTLYEFIQPSLGEKLRNIEWSSRYAREKYEGFVNRVKLCANLALAVHHIHDKGNAVIVDLKPQNILCQSNGYIFITDCDSFQIKTDDGIIHRAKVATPEYAPPESGIDPNTNTLIDSNWDNFSLAIIIYEVLFGIHPYAANYGGKYDESNTVRQRIANNLFVHSVEPQLINFIPEQHSLFNQLPNEIKVLFKRAFSSVERPTPKEWRIALGNLLSIESNRVFVVNIISKANDITNNRVVSSSKNEFANKHISTVHKLNKEKNVPNVKSKNIVSSNSNDGYKVFYMFMIILVIVILIATLL
jgi:hypothetical protein